MTTTTPTLPLPFNVTSLLIMAFDAINQSTLPITNISSSSSLPPPPPTGAGGLLHMRMALTLTHLLLVSLGSVNLLVIALILLRPYMRSITNLYILSLCWADFIYLGNLTLVAATQLNNKSWPFSSLMCTLYHGTETTGKYGSVLFVVLLAGDRYCAMCQSSFCARYRNYRTAVVVSLVGWSIAILAASPLYIFSEVAMMRIRGSEQVSMLCIARWPSSDMARWYITSSSVLIFAAPLALIVFCYYNIINQLREALKGAKRLRRGASSRAPYHRVTRLVLWVVIFHVICWSPFWLFNLVSSILRLRISTQMDRVVVNIIHLFPYINCALNPLLYAVHAENFRIAFRSVFCGWRGNALAERRHNQSGQPEDSRCVLGGGGGGLTNNSSVINGSVAPHRSRSSAYYVKCSLGSSSERLGPGPVPTPTAKFPSVGVTGGAASNKSPHKPLPPIRAFSLSETLLGRRHQPQPPAAEAAVLEQQPMAGVLPRTIITCWEDEVVEGEGVINEEEEAENEECPPPSAEDDEEVLM